MITIEKAFDLEPYRSIINMIDTFPEGLERKHLSYELTIEMQNKKGRVIERNGTNFYKIRNEKKIIDYLDKNKLFDYKDKINKKCTSRNLLSKYLQKLLKLGIIEKKFTIKKNKRITKYFISEKYNELHPVLKNLELLEKQKEAILSEFKSKNKNKKTYFPIFCNKKMVIFSMQPNTNYAFRQLDKINEKYSRKFIDIKNQLIIALYSLEELRQEIFGSIELHEPVKIDDLNLTIILNSRIKNFNNKIFFSKDPFLRFYKSDKEYSFPHPVDELIHLARQKLFLFQSKFRLEM